MALTTAPAGIHARGGGKGRGEGGGGGKTILVFLLAIQPCSPQADSV